jgi:uncharacterized protein (TIGR03032 family)
MTAIRKKLDKQWGRHSREWRNPAQITSQWREAENTDPGLLKSRTRGGWWGLLEALHITLLVTREYEHLVIACSAQDGRRSETFWPVPHPSGLVADRENNAVYLASTRNPNQLFTLKPALTRPSRTIPLLPVASSFYPGSMYIHDLALIRGELYANAVGQNAVVKLGTEGRFQRVWWPRCIEVSGTPDFSANYIQMNSIAAGASLEESFFSASSSSIGKRRPGDPRYPVDGTGVIFSGKTRGPVCAGLTRPHSARLWRRRVWVANSGYGTLGFMCGGRLEVVARLGGWTRGLCIVRDVAFAATSRVIPEYACYAPGLDARSSLCAVNAICLKTGKPIASLEWPAGNQIFAVDWIDNRVTQGFPFNVRGRKAEREIEMFYSYEHE